MCSILCHTNYFGKYKNRGYYKSSANYYLEVYNSAYWIGYSWAYECLVKLLPTFLIVVLNILVLRCHQFVAVRDSFLVLGNQRRKIRRIANNAKCRHL
jgi:hypothetical protein